MRFAARFGFLGVALALVAPTLTAVETAGPAKADSIASVNHVVVLMQENRSFDHYFGQNTAATNPAPDGTPIQAYHETSYCEPADLDHSWNGAHKEYDNGAMDGFARQNAVAADPTGRRAMGYYTADDLPYYYALKNAFSSGDRYFQSVLSQTFPNRFYLLAGTSFGHIANDFPTSDPANQFSQRTIFENLDAAGVSWKIYFAQIPFAFEFAYVRNHAAGHVFPISQYYADAATGNLPQVSYVDPVFVGPTNVENDEHPPSNVQVGENFASNVVNSLIKSPNWSSSALFLTYDEDGGFFDSVPPPSAVAPDNIPPKLAPTDQPGAFDQYGFRVPMTVVSPYAKAGYVSHEVDDHTSILKFIENRFGLPSLTARDAAANGLTDYFDFTSPALLHPPALPAAPIDPAHAAQCLTAPPNGAF